MPNRIFLSYAHEDREGVDKVIKELSRKGILSEEKDVVMDAVQNIESGSYIRNLIRKRIESASKVILLWTEDSAKSQWVNYEAGMAEALGKPIIIVLPNKSAPKLPENLEGLQIVRL